MKKLIENLKAALEDLNDTDIPQGKDFNTENNLLRVTHHVKVALAVAEALSLFYDPSVLADLVRVVKSLTEQLAQGKFINKDDVGDDWPEDDGDEYEEAVTDIFSDHTEEEFDISDKLAPDLPVEIQKAVENAINSRFGVKINLADFAGKRLFEIAMVIRKTREEFPKASDPPMKR